METKASLNAQLAAAQKKHGAKSQAAGRIQYKLNQLNKDSKGTVVRTKDGKAVKSKTGVSRQKDASKKVRKPAVKKLTMDRNPNTVAKAATKVAPKKVTNKVTVTPYKAAKITSMPYTTAERQAEFNRFNEQHRKNLAAIKAAKKEAKRQNDSIDKMARKADKEMRANKKKTDRVKKQTAQEKAQAAYRKSAASVISSRKTGNYSGL